MSYPIIMSELLENDVISPLLFRNLTAKSPAFWFIARAVRDFVDQDGGGNLPVSGVIPDMFADSERYIQLQNVYREQANRDAENILRRVQQLLESVGRPAVSDLCKSQSEPDVNSFSFITIISA